jgi:uncharacterized membrane protein YdjX (TVP38/TMEM64 family)
MKDHSAKRTVFIIVLVVMTIGILLLYQLNILQPKILLTYIDTVQYGWLLFIGVCALALMIAFPIYPLVIGGGFLFGHTLGFVLSLTGSMAGAVSSFLLARLLFYDYFQKKIKNIRTFHWGKTSNQRKLTTMAGFSRLIPLVPTFVLNYGFGLTKIHFRRYTLASLIGMIPDLIIFSFFGSSLHNIYSMQFIIASLVAVCFGILVYKQRHRINLQ